jgi:hypothetical protein
MSERGVPEQTEQFSHLARIILQKARSNHTEDQERVTHWLGEAYHNLSLSACLTGSSEGLDDAQAWQAILHERLEKYNKNADRLALATSFNQLGICYITKGDTDSAMANFRKSIETYKGVEDAPQFSNTFPSISLSLLCALHGQPDEGDAVLSPVLEEHERVLGKDDVTTTR